MKFVYLVIKGKESKQVLIKCVYQMYPTHKTNAYFIWIALSIYIHTRICVFIMRYLPNLPASRKACA